MSSLVKFYKVTSLPSTLEPSSIYFVQNGTYAETYITNSTGVARSVGNSGMINALIDTKLNSLNTLLKVNTIADRNALALTQNAMVLVVNATGDATVTAGAALYFWDNAASTWTKISEYESMDVVVQWSSIQGKPTSTPAQIDAAVTNAHTHSNKATLDLLGAGANGLTYNGADVTTTWSTENW
jgi:hypothetical protein